MGRKIRRGDMGDVYFQKRDSGFRAVVYFRDSLGRRKRAVRSGKTKAAARRELLKHVELTQSGVTHSDKAVAMTLVEAVDRWLGDFKSKVDRGERAETTFDTYESVVRTHIRNALSDCMLDDFTPSMVDTFLQGVLKVSGYASAKQCRTVLSGTGYLLLRRGLISRNPVGDVPKLEAKKRKKKKRALTASQARAFLRHVREYDQLRGTDNYDLLLVLLATGCRVGEALALSWSCVDFSTGSVQIETTAARVKGRGIVVGPTKSEAGERNLTLPGWCLEVLRDRRERRPDGEIIFPTATGAYRDRSAVGKQIRAMRGTQWSWVTSHTFRRTMATLMDDSGASARAVADQLGHSRISTTLDVYMARAGQSDAARVMDAVFGGDFG